MTIGPRIRRNISFFRIGIAQNRDSKGIRGFYEAGRSQQSRSLYDDLVLTIIRLMIQSFQPNLMFSRLRAPVHSNKKTNCNIFRILSGIYSILEILKKVFQRKLHVGSIKVVNQISQALISNYSSLRISFIFKSRFSEIFYTIHGFYTVHGHFHGPLFRQACSKTHDINN